MWVMLIKRRPSKSTTEDNIQKVGEMIRSNRRVSITEIAQKLSISIGIILRWLHAQGADFYRQGNERLVKRLQRLGDYVEK